MAFDSSITAYFGGDTTNLRAATTEASIMVKGFSGAAGKAVREISEGFLGAVVFAEAVKGIKDIAEAAMDAAEQARNMSDITGKALTDEQQAWVDLKDGITGSGASIKTFATAALEALPEMGYAT